MTKNKKPEDIREDNAQDGLVHEENVQVDTGAKTEDLGSHLNQETAVITWDELVRHFARGVVLNVTSQLDLIDVAACLAKDDAECLQLWLDKGLLRRATDDDARDWTIREPEFWCVVTAPWVLVQEQQTDEPQADQTVVH